MKKISPYMRIAAFMLLSFFMAACVVGDKTEEADYEIIKVGDKVPKFEISDKSGNLFTSPDDITVPAKTTLIVFFSPTCIHCKVEMPSIQYIVDQTAGDPDLQVLNMSVNTEGLAEYWQQSGFTMNYCIDAGRRVYSFFAKQYVPRFYIVGADGIVKWVFVGETDMSKEQFLAKFRSFR